MLEIKKDVKVGELYRIYSNAEESKFISVFKVEEVLSSDQVQVADLQISLKDQPTNHVFRHVTYIHFRDQKITDPGEKAYWLLRMENAGN